MTADGGTGGASRHDLVVVGSGAAGMTAALVAAAEGLSVAVVEKASAVGGTTARSGGAIWIPDSPQHAASGRAPDGASARRYLDALVGDGADPALRAAFLDAGPRMVAYLAARADVHFDLSPDEPDYRSELPGASDGGRVLRPRPFDGRRLGRADFGRLAAPLPELTLFGGMMVTRAEAAALTRIPWSGASFALGARLVGRHLRDRLVHRRGTRLVLGNALAAALFLALRRHRVAVHLDARVVDLVVDARGVRGVVVDGAAGRRTIGTRHGVVLAGGGFPADAGLRGRHLPAPVATHTPAAPTCTGDTLVLAERLGAELRGGGHNALWFPSSVGRRRDGTDAVFPHIVDRARPGVIAVDGSGRRFVGEAVSYHEFGRAMYGSATAGADGAIAVWLVCERAFVDRNGLGLVRPRPFPRGGHLRSGYLVEAADVPRLAEAIGVDPAALADTIARHNRFAASGVDEDHGRGSRAYDRSNGEAGAGPNPCLGPIVAPPFCAVRLWPTPLATCLGVRTDAHARVLRASGEPIDGLYACGNDMASVTGGEYAGAGAQIGPGMAFGWLAAMHAAGRAAGAGGALRR